MKALKSAMVLGVLAVAGCDAPDEKLDGEYRGKDDTKDVVVDGELLCEDFETSACPGSDDSDLERHGGLLRGSRCQFQLTDQGTWDTSQKLLDELEDELPRVDMSDLLADLDRVGTRVDSSNSELARLEGMQQGFRWDNEDFNAAEWMPQGVSGSADATASGTVEGREVLAVSWYHKPEKSASGVNEGSRISFVDTTELDKGSAPYRHVLLVEPFDNNGTPDFRPIYLHVGGIAWVGDYLYATDTSQGLRVFDTSQLIKVNGDGARAGKDKDGTFDAFGYDYVLPQVGAYFLPAESCWHRFSFVGLDKTSEVPSLVTGEFHDGDVAGKLMRWPLDGVFLAEDEEGGVRPSEVFYAQESDMQGAVSVNGEWYLSCSGQDGAHGLLYRADIDGGSDSEGWVIGPEDLMFDARDNALWSASEFAGRRFLFSVAAK